MASLTNLFLEYELDINNNLSIKRKRFQNFIDVMIET